MKLFQKLINLVKQSGINANKIELSANDILNLLAGNEINLGSKSITIKSNNFSVDENGNMSCSNADITGGKIELTAQDGKTALIKLKSSTNENSYLGLYDFGLSAIHEGNTLINMTEYTFPEKNTYYGKINIMASNGESETEIRPDAVFSPNFTQTSLETQKKNFEKLQDNALETIKNIDIYKYNLKSEKDTDKKHIGFVISDKYNYSKEVTSLDNKGVDNYSFTSLCCKAIQEQQEMIEKLENRIKEMEDKLNEIN